VPVSSDALWETWSHLEDWKSWSASHTRAGWVDEPGWQVGARFTQTLWLGFPLGFRSSVETISEVNPGRKVRWSKRQGGVKSCHIWSFTLLPNRNVRIATTGVFHGTAIGLLKPIVFWQWQRQFEKSLDNLVNLAREKSAP
jgi:hypothetical protein